MVCLTQQDWFQSTNCTDWLGVDWDTLTGKDGVRGDYITQRIGVFGRYQLRCFLLVQFVGVFAAWQVLVRKIKINISCVTMSE